jgi:dihydroneopterin triphosphate diphosphatase
MPNVRHDMIACYVFRPTENRASHEVLQLLRAPNDYLGNTWQSVYGTGEINGEPLWQMAIRELREEIGLAPRELYRLPTIWPFYVPETDTIFHCTRFAALIERDDVIKLNHEHVDFRWFKRAKAPKFFMWATDRYALAEAFRDVLDDSPAKPYLRISLS